MSEVVLTLNVQCGHTLDSGRRWYSAITVPRDEMVVTNARFFLCDGCAALAERAEIELIEISLGEEIRVDSEGRSPGGTDD